MISIPGAIGKADALASYIMQLQSETNPSDSEHGKKRKLNDQSVTTGHIQFPVSLPTVDPSILTHLITILDQCQEQKLFVTWNYSKLLDTIIATMKVFSESNGECILENECVIMSNQFSEGRTSRFEDNTLLFVAIAFAADLSLLTVSRILLCPSTDKRSLNLKIDVDVYMERARSRKAEELILAIARILNLTQVTITEPPLKKPRNDETLVSALITPPASTNNTPSSSAAVSPPVSSSITPLSTSTVVSAIKKGKNNSSDIQFSPPPIPADVSLEGFFSNLQPPVSDQYLERYVCPDMTVRLTSFQTQNVEWMIQKEGHKATSQGVIIRDYESFHSLPFLYSNSQSGNYVNLFTDKTTNDLSEITRLNECSYKGGILADEMGLGKTVSVLGLISKHTYKPNDPSHPKASKFPKLIISKGTLIVAPGSIMSQWASEAKKHAPHLKVYEYHGAAKDKISALRLAKYDVVLVYYETFKSELAHSKPPPDRPRRKAVKYEFKVSPLMSILWFRCILDEAQMVESTTTRVAAMANQIPRWYSWAVTGTPMKSDYNDLFGLYNFLQLEETISAKPSVFKEFHSNLRYKGLFFAFTKATMRRNMKSLLSSQIFIPNQSRHVVRIPFSTIEQHYYEDLYRRCRQTLRLDWVDSINWELPIDASESTIETFHQIKLRMRSWLLALRQNCIHPSVIVNPSLRLGNQNNTALVGSNKRTQSLDEVLQDMAKGAKDLYDNNQHVYYCMKLKHGGMYELIEDWNNAVETYLEAIPKVEALVKFHLEEHQSMQNNNKRVAAVDNASNTAEEADEEEERKSKLTNKAGVLIKWQTLLHQFYFYLAGVYHVENSEDLEIMYYSKAADVRRVLLEKQSAKVELAMQELNKTSSRVMPCIENNVGPCDFEEDLLKFKAYNDEELEDDEEFEEGDRRERDGDMNTLLNLKRIGIVLDKQYEKILFLRNKTLGILKKQLVDNSDGQEDATGDEYEDSLSEQEMCQVYVSAYQALLQDRKFIINGTLASITDLMESNDNGEYISDKAREVERVEKNFRKSLKSPGYKIECIKDIESFLRSLKNTMRKHESEPEYNVLIFKHEWLKTKYIAQSKLLEDLDVDIKKFSQLFNSRIAYYKHLQHISDTLLEWKHSNPRAEIRTLERAEKKQEELIAKNRSRDMYFKALAEEQKNIERTGEKIRKDCLICQEPLEKGMITYCGHTSCVDCGLQWFKNSRRCHTCNSTVNPDEWYNVSYKQIEMQDKDSGQSSKNSDDTQRESSSNDINNNGESNLKRLIEEINTQNITEGQGAKLDSIIRHIKHIKISTNGKCVVFSQWSKVLDMIKAGLTANNIQCITLSGGINKSCVTKFQEDPNINVILLHARSQSSGLTLVSAQTVFIVEPVFNESLEKQAINRVHRIGQTKQTSVFWYIVQDTIEERIQEIHNRKRDKKIRSSVAEIDDDLALSTLSDGGGEYVNDDDLRRCFTSNENLIY